MFNSVNLVSQKAASSLKSCFFVGNAVSGQLNLERCKFWQLTSQLLALDVCLCDAFVQANVFKKSLVNNGLRS
ncbi:DUF645 family protein [Vibrio cholerae]|nr:DUF645 family protein [Vibrio cholerae]